MSTNGLVSASLLRLAAGPAAASSNAVALQRHLKLKDAAERFEGMMLQELLKPMQEGKGGAFGGYGGGFGSEEDDRDDSLDTISSFGTEAVATAIAKAGGVGIAKQVLREVGALDPFTKGTSYGPGQMAEAYHRGRLVENKGLESQNGSRDGKPKKKS